jgi:uncharacterized Zn-finger protein
VAFFFRLPTIYIFILLECLVSIQLHSYIININIIGLLKFHVFFYRCLYEGCGKHYYSLNSLNSHSRSHQHKEEEVRCQWEGCGKLFDKPCRLKAHMRSHTGDKPYLCMYPVTTQLVLPSKPHCSVLVEDLTRMLRNTYSFVLQNIKPYC